MTMQQRFDKGRIAHGCLGSNKHGSHLIETKQLSYYNH